MALRKYLMGAFLNLFLFTTAANANYFEDNDMCTRIIGGWTGDMAVSAELAGREVVCKYHGSAFVTKKNASDNDVKFIFDLQSGPNICPKREIYAILGTCDSQRSTMTLKSDTVNLTGPLTYNGWKADLRGTVNIKILNESMIANVYNLVMLRWHW
jgi:hypothetical protein